MKVTTKKLLLATLATVTFCQSFGKTVHAESVTVRPSETSDNEVSVNDATMQLMKILHILTMMILTIIFMAVMWAMTVLFVKQCMITW